MVPLDPQGKRAHQDPQDDQVKQALLDHQAHLDHLVCLRTWQEYSLRWALD